MNITSLVIPIYDWKVTVFTNVVNPQDIETIREHCQRYGVDPISSDETVNNLVGYHNSGCHLYNEFRKLAFLFFSPIDTEFEFWRIVPHELDHLVDSIAGYHRLEREGRGYLTGFVYSSFYQLGIMDELKKFFYVEPEVEPENTCYKVETPELTRDRIMSTFLSYLGVRVNDEDNSDKLESFFNLMKSEFSNKTLEELIISAENKPLIEGGI